MFYIMILQVFRQHKSDIVYYHADHTFQSATLLSSIYDFKYSFKNIRTHVIHLWFATSFIIQIWQIMSSRVEIVGVGLGGSTP